MMTRSKYETPVLRAHGKVEDITKANSGGARLDMTFVSGTLLADITTS